MIIILKPVVLCIITLIIINFAKKFFPEYVILILISFGAIIMMFSVEYVITVFDALKIVINRNVEFGEIMTLIIKITFISLICEFTSKLCMDTGNEYIAIKIVLCGKLIILSVIIPSFMEYIQYVFELLPSVE